MTNSCRSWSGAIWLNPNNPAKRLLPGKSLLFFNFILPLRLAKSIFSPALDQIGNKFCNFFNHSVLFVLDTIVTMCYNLVTFNQEVTSWLMKIKF